MFWHVKQQGKVICVWVVMSRIGKGINLCNKVMIVYMHIIYYWRKKDSFIYLFLSIGTVICIELLLYLLSILFAFTSYSLKFLSHFILIYSNLQIQSFVKFRNSVGLHILLWLICVCVYVPMVHIIYHD